MSVLHVVVDYSLVPRRRVRAFAQVLEKHPDEHRAERHAQYDHRALLTANLAHLACFVQRILLTPCSREPSLRYYIRRCGGGGRPAGPCLRGTDPIGWFGAGGG